MLRKVNDIWNSIDDQRDAKMDTKEWRRSYEGVKAALLYVGLVLVTTKDELDTMEVPEYKDTFKRYNERNVIVSRNGVLGKPTGIKNLLSGNSQLLTSDETYAIHNKGSDGQKKAKPKGVATCNNIEDESIKALDNLIDMASIFDREFIHEHRLGDVAYCEKNIGGNPDDEVYFAEQIKTATAGENSNRLTFGASDGHLTVDIMKNIIKKNMSLICIGKTDKCKVDVVWMFYGEKGLDMLNKFENTQTFQPRLHLQIKSTNDFTIAYNSKDFRYDVGCIESKEERQRFFKERAIIIRSGIKHSLQFLNEDDSQIPNEYHRNEQHSLMIIQEACKKVGVEVHKIRDDAYTCVDFRVDGCRVQEKTLGENGTHVHIRNLGGLPYDSDKIDILQISQKLKVYVIPMRKYDGDGNIVSNMSEADLVKIKYGRWKQNIMCDLSTKKGIQKYVKLCAEAKEIPSLTDHDFYKNMITKNAHIFTSESDAIRKKRNTKKISNLE